MAQRRPVRRTVGIAILLMVCVGGIAPFLSADAFKQRIRESLKRSLHREVEIQGKVNFTLLSGPGFSVGQVLIREDPSIGIEPFAYVDSLQARVKMASLLFGRLEFSTLKLSEPSVNLVKTQSGAWNVQPFLNRTVAAKDDNAPSGLPNIQVLGARLNFKFGDTKSVFYVTNTDIYIAPASNTGDAFNIEFAGEPARTDRAAQGFGRLKGSGQWRSFRNADSEMTLDLQLERSAIAEVTMLLQGRDIGLHGLVASHAKLTGPLSNIQVAGSLTIEDVHRWDLMPAKGDSWPLEYGGHIDLRSQKLEIKTSASKDAVIPVSFNLRASNWLAQPRWGFTLTLKDLPLAPMVELARHVGAPLPPRLIIDGKAEGVISYSPEAGTEGQLALQKAWVQVADSRPIRVEEAQVIFDPKGLTLVPTTMEFDNGRTAIVEGSYAREGPALDLKINTRSMAVTDLLSGSGALLGASAVPLIEKFQSGDWHGWVRYKKERDDEGQWSGNFSLEDVHVTVPGIVDPLRSLSAQVVLQGNRVVMQRLQAKVGKLKLEGDYRYIPEAARPHRLHLTVAEADAAELDRLLMPTLRRRQGFIARTLRIGSPTIPDWLSERHVDGSLRIGKLSLGDTRFTGLRTRLLWDGANVELSELEAHDEDAVINGRLSINLGKGLPDYRMTGQVRNLSWRGGTLDADGTIHTFGTGNDSLINLRSEGAFSGRSLDLVPENEFRTITGEYEITFARGVPQLKLSSLQVSLGSDMFSGQGSTLSDGRLQLELTSGRKLMRIAGTLLPLHLDLAPR